MIRIVIWSEPNDMIHTFCWAAVCWSVDILGFGTWTHGNDESCGSRGSKASRHTHGVGSNKKTLIQSKMFHFVLIRPQNQQPGFTHMAVDGRSCSFSREAVPHSLAAGSMNNGNSHCKRDVPLGFFVTCLWLHAWLWVWPLLVDLGRVADLNVLHWLWFYFLPKTDTGGSRADTVCKGGSLSWFYF